MNKIICGDALATLKTLESGIVQTCVTSPPYYGLRDYGVSGQIGLEESPEAYIARLVEVFREVKRVLRDDGTCWINVGDSYNSSTQFNHHSSGLGDAERYNEANGKKWAGHRQMIDGLKPKDLIGIPWMLAFALRADGWYLRQELIWNKPNCMPESVTDRCTKSHETIFMLSKRERYFYDAQAIAEPLQGDGRKRGACGGKQAGVNGNATYSGRVWEDDPAGRNKRSVWTVSTRAYEHAHFATFPPKLIEPCILAGTSPRACEHCGAPWERVLSPATGGAIGKAWNDHKDDLKLGNRANNLAKGGSGYVPPQTLGWQPTCNHSCEGTAQCIVLDPFAGAGTTALVSIQHHRDYIAIELNPEYVTLMNERIDTVQPVLWEV